MTFHKLSFKIYCTNILNNRFYQATEVNLNRLKKKICVSLDEMQAS